MAVRVPTILVIQTLTVDAGAIEFIVLLSRCFVEARAIFLTATIVVNRVRHSSAHSLLVGLRVLSQLVLNLFALVRNGHLSVDHRFDHDQVVG